MVSRRRTDKHITAGVGGQAEALGWSVVFTAHALSDEVLKGAFGPWLVTLRFIRKRASPTRAKTTPTIGEITIVGKVLSSRSRDLGV